MQGYDDATAAAALASEVEEADKQSTETFGSSAADMPAKVSLFSSLQEGLCSHQQVPMASLTLAGVPQSAPSGLLCSLNWCPDASMCRVHVSSEPLVDLAGLFYPVPTVHQLTFGKCQ